MHFLWSHWRYLICMNLKVGLHQDKITFSFYLPWTPWVPLHLFLAANESLVFRSAAAFIGQSPPPHISPSLQHKCKFGFSLPWKHPEGSRQQVSRGRDGVSVSLQQQQLFIHFPRRFFSSLMTLFYTRNPPIRQKLQEAETHRRLSVLLSPGSAAPTATETPARICRPIAPPYLSTSLTPWPCGEFHSGLCHRLTQQTQASGWAWVNLFNCKALRFINAVICPSRLARVPDSEVWIHLKIHQHIPSTLSNWAASIYTN